MAKNPRMTMPIDSPAIVDEYSRLVHREADFFASDSRFGFGAAHMTGFIGISKGNRAVQGSPRADVRFEPVFPFIIKR